jgi:hypothetical protein
MTFQDKVYILDLTELKRKIIGEGYSRNQMVRLLSRKVCWEISDEILEDKMGFNTKCY